MKRSEALQIRNSLDNLVVKIADAPAEINDNPAAIRNWKEGAYVIGDVRMDAGNPYKCVQAHDSTGNPTWNPAATPALWMQYHGTTKETARPFIHPAGAHDMYKKGEYASFDDVIKQANQDTVYSPDEYPDAWDTV